MSLNTVQEILKLPQFQGSEATVKFLRMFDHLFDVLNSRNPLAKGYKSPLCVSNQHIWDPFLNEAFTYISGLKEPSGTPIDVSPFAFKRAMRDGS